MKEALKIYIKNILKSNESVIVESAKDNKQVFVDRKGQQIDVEPFKVDTPLETIEAKPKEEKKICLTEEQFGNNITRTALMLKEALDTQNTKVMKDMINILLRDTREYSIHSFHGSNYPYSEMLQKLNMKHLLSLCESCIKEHNIKNIVGNSEYPYFFDTGTCKQCGQKCDVYVGYREDLDVLRVKNEFC